MMSLRQEGLAITFLFADITQGGLAKWKTAYIVDNGFSPPPPHLSTSSTLQSWRGKNAGLHNGFATLVNHEQLLNKSHLFAKETPTRKEDVMQLFTSVMQI